MNRAEVFVANLVSAGVYCMLGIILLFNEYQDTTFQLQWYFAYFLFGVFYFISLNSVCFFTFKLKGGMR